MDASIRVALRKVDKALGPLSGSSAKSTKRGGAVVNNTRGAEFSVAKLFKVVADAMLYVRKDVATAGKPSTCHIAGIGHFAAPSN